MFRIGLTIASVAATALTFGLAVPARAQAPVYRAVPVTAVAKPSSVIVGDSLWACGSDGCTTSNATSRPAIVCAQVVKKLGKLDSFTGGSTAFDAAALAKCNERAKDMTSALARN